MAKKTTTENNPNVQKDDFLFEALGKTKKRKKRKIIITVSAVVLVLAIFVAVGVAFLQKRVREEFATSSGEVLAHEVTTGTISTVVSGSGSLADVDLTVVSVPEGVEITEIVAKANQSLAVGDVLATVDMATVVSAMADLQTEIKNLDEEIDSAEDDKAAEVIYSGVSGRVKAIFAQADSSVAEVMHESGALALLSLDGYMAIDFETDAVSAGDTVTVRLSSEEEISGTVESVVNGKATVLIGDNGPQYDEAVTVLNQEGQTIGNGNLYIHSPLRITGYAGTVGKVLVSLNQKVTSSTKVFNLTDTEYSANYNSLLRTRKEKEDVLLSLLTIKRDGAVLSSMAGSVYSVGDSEDETVIATISADEKMSVTVNVDEADILALELGQEVSVSVSSVSEDAFEGTLTEINRTSSSSGVYTAVVELEKAEGMLSGMTAEVSVMIEGVENAILVPIEAVHKTGDGAYVYTSYNEELQEYGGKVDVVCGLENSTYVEIKSGLEVGDTVYYTEQSRGFGGMSGMPDFGGMNGMPDFGGSGGGMPSFGDSGSGGSRPNFGSGGSGSNRPNFGGGGMAGFGN